MGELTEQEKLERRRLKRQQRILQAGESRLNKITGTAYPNRATPSPTPSPSTSSINNNSTTSIPSSFNTQRRMSDDPSEELGAPPPLDMNTLMQQQMASMFGGVSGVPGSTPSDPLQQLFGNAGAGGPNAFNPASLLSTMMNGGGAMPEQTEQQQQLVDKSSRYWNLLHVIMMVMLGLYAVYTEWTRAGRERFASLLSSDVNNYPAIHVPLFWYFITIELGLQSARLFYQQGVMPPTSTLAQLATQLPPPFGNIVTICLRYRLIWSCLSQDICILVFVIGISQVISNLL